LIPGVGVRLAEKIWEIAESGNLQKLEELSSQEEIKALELFKNVWGAGICTAQAWVRRGYRNLDDLKADDAGLTKNQQIGLKYYDEFLERMDRDEAGKIEAQVHTISI
jgi:DNA polymerase lambda